MAPNSYQVYHDIPDDMLQHYSTQDIIAVDTELHGLRLYRDEVCLVQICDDRKQVCLVAPKPGQTPNNLIKLMTAPNVMKVFHFALTDIAFFKTSLDVDVAPFRCTKVMSKLVRTYTDKHGLKDVCSELLGVDLAKEQQQTNWASPNLTKKQMEYAANDVLYLVRIYRGLLKMIEERPTLSTGGSLPELHETSQNMIPGMVNLLIHGYGDLDKGWQTTLFIH